MTKESDKSNSTYLSNLKGSRGSRTHYSTDLNRQLIGERVRIAGWIEDIRPLGSIVFITVRDVKGVSQAVFQKTSLTKELFEAAEKVPRQSCVIIEGVVKESRAKGLEVEVKGDKLTVLSEAVHPLPIDPTGRVKASIDIRLNSRALDLKNPRIAAIFKIRHTTLQSIRKTFIDMGFLEVNTSRIIEQAAEGGANLFTVDYFGKKAYLAQSPQLYKEQLTTAFDRVFEIGNFFRAEKSATRKHLGEFISVDTEAAFYDEYDVMDIAEQVVVNAIQDVNDGCKAELQLLDHQLKAPKRPFPRFRYEQVILELQERNVKISYGDDLTDSLLRKFAVRHRGFYWIIEWPLKLKPFYIAANSEHKDISRGFDLQYRHLELASGGTRVSDKNELERRIREAGLDVESFSEHLRAFSWGMPPHSGWGFGLDRFIMVLTGVKNIREVVLYPRDRFRLTP